MAEASVGASAPKSKRCKSCKKLKPHNDFRASIRTEDGLSSLCVHCYAKRQVVGKYQYEVYPEGSKRCTYCRKIIPFSEFHKDTHKRFGLASGCKTCARAQNKARDREKQNAFTRDWRARNQEHIKAYKVVADAEYRKKNPQKKRQHDRNRRAKKMGAEGFHAVDDIHRIRRAQGGKCAACKCKGKLSIDHIIPLSRGGSNWPSNIQLLCRTCNCKKHAKANEDFFRQNFGTLL